MNDIALPQKVDFKEGDKPNQGIISIEPCYPGYGTTLGNSLRRVLLSSLPGAAVIGVKIEGADHEFMTLPHVKEDVLEIVLNLKGLRLKVHSDEEVKLELNVAGEKEVTAADITKNSEVEIVNPDLVIAHVTDMAGSLNMEITVSKGRGYRTIESVEEKKHEIGYIEMDSIFSPVTSTGLSVENVRVGKMTNWEKLVLDVVTDGTITPKEAYEQTVDILIDQYGALIGKTGEQVKEEVKAKKEVEEAEAEEESLEDADETVETEEKDEEQKKKRGRPKKEDN